MQLMTMILHIKTYIDMLKIFTIKYYMIEAYILMYLCLHVPCMHIIMGSNLKSKKEMDMATEQL